VSMSIGKKRRLFINSFLSLSPNQKLFFRNTLLAFLLWALIGNIPQFHEFLVVNLASFSSVLIELLSGLRPEVSGHSLSGTDEICCRIYDFRSSLKIAQPCDGWELYYLSAAFVFVFPGFTIKRKTIFALLGVFILYFFNLLRIVALFFMAGELPKFFAFYHHYVFQILAYLLMFLIWSIFLRKDNFAKL